MTTDVTPMADIVLKYRAILYTRGGVPVPLICLVCLPLQVLVIVDGTFDGIEVVWRFMRESPARIATPFNPFKLSIYTSITSTGSLYAVPFCHSHRCHRGATVV
jgi:hypothetical protein